MQLYLLLLPVLYLFVSYISIYKMNTIYSSVLRMVMGGLLILIVAMINLTVTPVAWWEFAVIVMLVGNVEITAFKYSKGDQKGVFLLNVMTLLIFVISTILTFVLY
ncbi:membrane stabilizing protein MspA [Staphylococcus simulans]|uniref:membrane stabilizing protein MspA n=1 Tax=Staphylococcus simulans TaxID=1286 RepID=UPI0021D0951F|nr:membrane stabilizing protein MspA [Staphylococcus simulans]UXR53199.1 membrane stabilizing protein MspA [Staphylococcus simulans]